MSGVTVHRGAGGANCALSNLAAVAVETAVVFNPGSDIDTDLLEVNVTGTPKFWWDEETDSFEMNKSLTLPGGSLKLGSHILSEDTTVDDDGFSSVGTLHLLKHQGGIAGNLCIQEGTEPDTHATGDRHRLWVDVNHDIMWQDHEGNSRIIHAAGGAAEYTSMILDSTAGIIYDPGADVDCTIFTIDVSYTWIAPLLKYDRSSEFLMFTRPLNVSLVGLGNPSRFMNFGDGTIGFDLWAHGATPEGAITASTGSLSVDAGLGRLYVKTTDGVDTGWKQLQDEPFDGDIQYLYNSAGELHLQHDSEGNVRMFDGQDVADGTDGERLYIYRRAAEGDSYFSVHADRNQVVHLNSNVDIAISDGIYDYLVMTESDHMVNALYGLQVGGVDVLTAESDPVFTAWDKSTGILIIESQISDLDHFTTEDEGDPVFLAWDKSTGILISELQITDLVHFTTEDETDPVYSTWKNNADTNGIDFPSFENSAGGLKIQPDVQGDVALFGGTDVLNNASGRMLYVHRRAAEGNDYLRLFVTGGRVCYIQPSNDFFIKAPSGKYVKIETGTNIYLDLADKAGVRTVQFRDSDKNTKATIDSDGNAQFDGAMEIDGDLNHDGSNAGLYGATPAPQPVHIVDADGTLGDLTTKFNTLLAQMATLGLQAAS